MVFSRISAPPPADTSLWADQVEPTPRRPALDRDRQVDVAIVGAGYTGLWTAYNLLCAEPTTRVLVIDAAHVGAGASGRNGGWCVGELAGGLDSAIALSQQLTGSPDAGRRLTRAIIDTVPEVGRVVAHEKISCDFEHGGAIRLARTALQRERQIAEVAAHAAQGFGHEVFETLDALEARAVLNATNVVGGVRFAACARLHPARLVHGLAAVVERLGVVIVEDTPVTEIVAATTTRSAHLHTSSGTVHADVIVRALEGFTPSLRGHQRTMIPFASSMIATEPLTDEMWEHIGLTRNETFADDRRMVIYGQRTADGRIAFGGRGAPYRFGSRVESRFGSNDSSGIHERLTEVLHDVLPATRDVAITHRWGGVLGIPRDWQPSVGFDPSSGLAWAGGFVGEGVAAANLAGRTLADLITHRETDLTTLPWVGHVSRRWEPEPLRWIGITSLLKLTAQADAAEQRTGRASRRGAFADHLRGH